MNSYYTADKRHIFKTKDPISALTHFIGLIGALIGMPILLIKGALDNCNMFNLISLSIFIFSMIMLYGASTAYHTFSLLPKAGLRLKTLDHMMIFVLIAGSYTPMCTMVLSGPIGKRLLIIIWTIALVGILFNLFWITCPRWLSSVIYIAMGWAAVFAFGPLYHSMELGGFILLLLGGIMYSIGGVIYALKIKELAPGFGAHEIFHIFVLIGSMCHFVMMLVYVA